MKSQKLTVTLMCAGLAVIFSVGVGFAAYTFTVGPASAAGNVSIQVNPYVYLKGIHPGDGGFYYTDASGKTKQYWFSNETSPIFTLYGQTVDSTGAVTGCTLNNDGLEINSAGNALSTTRDYNSVTVTAISNLITIDGATVSAQKLILPTFFIDERDGTKYYVTRYDPQPDKKAGKKTGNFTLFGSANNSSYTDSKGGTAITELDFGTNEKLRYLGPRAFGYLHNLTTMNLAGCPNLKFLDDWSLCRCDDLINVSLPVLSTSDAITYKSIYDTGGTMSASLKGAFHLSTSLDVVDFRAQRGITTYADSMFADSNGVKKLVISTGIQAIYRMGFGCFYGNGANVVSGRRIFYEGNLSGLQGLLGSSLVTKDWVKYQEAWDGFDHMVHCLTAESDGTYQAATLTSKKGGNVSYTYGTDTSGEQANAPQTVVTNRLVYKESQ
jgi:hypothetical protein